MDSKIHQQITRRQFFSRAMLLVGGLALPKPFLRGTIGDPVKVETSMVEFSAYGEKVSGYLAQPVGQGPFPSVVVIPEWWGLDGQIRGVAERLAAEGFVALAPDLYRGQVATGTDEARRLAQQLEAIRAVRDIQGAVNFLGEQPFTLSSTVGILSFCFGGRLGMMLSYIGKNIGAVVVCFGGQLDPRDANLVSASLSDLDIYGEYSGLAQVHVMAPPELTQAMNPTLKRRVKSLNPLILHAFFDRTQPAQRPILAADAWQRTIRWFTQSLGDRV